MEARTGINKKTLSEDDISAKYITPAAIKAGWDEATQIRRQVYFTKGRIIVRGKLVTRGKAKRADFFSATSLIDRPVCRIVPCLLNALRPNEGWN